MVILTGKGVVGNVCVKLHNSALYYRVPYLKTRFTQCITCFYNKGNELQLSKPFFNTVDSYINNTGIRNKLIHLEIYAGK